MNTQCQHCAFLDKKLKDKKLIIHNLPKNDHLSRLVFLGYYSGYIQVAFIEKPLNYFKNHEAISRKQCL
jgi:hypothetical protein